jgi:hypothetical protein
MSPPRSTKAFEPAEAPAWSSGTREWHYTPKHSNWLNLAEPELAVLSSQCLDRRIPHAQLLTQKGTDRRIFQLHDYRNEKREARTDRLLQIDGIFTQRTLSSIRLMAATTLPSGCRQISLTNPTSS